ncbi:hypothetical protein [Sphingomonas sp. LaA6.9]|uniref:hypothetical protein n=1 Tax=Sphingomonas sp. LaA6.9 TaxID=2919914 RepID=UPI001F4F7132|nr:hypothetical protein [Sphingomonas sp. LaA6.9]MCJ8159856.1 hypothetical protein [Sphingomonas sp. LaA6.9]
MGQAKFTTQRGKPNLKDVVVAAGAAEAQSDTMSLNIDYTKITKGDALIMIDNIAQKIHAGKWPPL